MQVFLGNHKYFDIEYKINPWMQEDVEISFDKANEQYNAIIQAFKDENIPYKISKPAPYPDSVFIADSGFLINNIFICTNFKYKERQREVIYWQNFFQEQGYETVILPSSVLFEGTGDLIYTNSQVFLGHGIRTNLEAVKHIKPFIQKDIFPIELINDRFFHLDTCFFPIDDKNILLYKDAIAPESLKKLKEKYNIITAEKKEAMNFALNIFRYEKTLFLNKGNPKTKKLLEEYGYKVAPLDLSEFIKAGGAIKCMTLKEEEVN